MSDATIATAARDTAVAAASTAADAADGAAESVVTALAHRNDAQAARDEAQDAAAEAANDAAAIIGRRYQTLTSLLAATTPALGTGTTWLADRHQYVEADPSASDHHLTTAGGVKLYVVPKNGAVELAAFNVDATTSCTGKLLQAAAVAPRVILPPSQITIASKPSLDADLIGSVGSVVRFTMLSGRGLDMAAGRQIKGVKFTSDYAGPSSAADAVDALAGGAYDYGSRSIGLNTLCHVEDIEVEHASQGLHVLGIGVTGKRVNIHDIRHYKGWGAAIHRDTASASYSHFEDVTITDCDRGTETEAGASYNLTERVTYTRVGPSGYTGQPGTYEVYTFIADAHSHVGEGACVGNVYRNIRLVDCMGGITAVRSDGTNDSDMPRDNVWENVTIEGRVGTGGYESVYVQGHNNKVKNLRLRLGSGVTSKMTVLFAGGGSSDNHVEIDEASAYYLPLAKVGTDNTATDNRLTVKRVSAPAGGSGKLIQVYGPRTVLDLSIHDVTGTDGYLAIESPATGTKTIRFDYTVKNTETFTQVALVTGAAAVQLDGINGYNAATSSAVKDIATSGGTTYLSGSGKIRRVTSGISVDLGGASQLSNFEALDIINGRYNDAGTGNLIPRQGVMDFESTFGQDPGVVAQVLAGGSVSGSPTANQATLVRRRARRRMIPTKLRWVVGTSSGNYDICILSAAGVVLWSKGSTAVPASGMVEETVSGVTLEKGTVFYIGLVFDNTTATVKGVTVATSDALRTLGGTLAATFVSSSFPFPSAGSSVTVGTSAGARLPLVTMHE